jgi:autotransporter-associated beta strand protein
MRVHPALRHVVGSCARFRKPILLLALALSAHADPVVTDALWLLPTGGNWTDPLNWSSAPDYPSGVGATARFSSLQAAQRIVNFDANITVGNLVIDNATAFANTFGVSGVTTPTLTFDAAEPGPAKLPATITVTGNSTGAATPNTVFATVVLNDDLVVTVDRTSSTSVAGTFTFRGGLTGVGGVTKEGAGTLTMADNAKTFTGPLIVNNGRMRINVPAGRPTRTSGVTINGAGQLDLAGAGSYTFGASDTKLTLNGPGPANNFPTTFGGTVRVDGAGANAITNDIVLQSTSSIHVQGAVNTTTLPGVVSGPGGLVLPTAGSDGNIGTLVLAGANTYVGGTTINDGTVTATGPSGLGAPTGPLAVNNQNNGQAGKNVALNLSTSDPTTVGSLSGSIATPTSGVNTVTINAGGPIFTVNQTTSATFPGVIAGAGGFTLGGASTATLTLTGVNTYVGETVVNAGTLRVGGVATASITSSAGVTVNGGTFEVTETQTVRALNVAPGGNALLTRRAGPTVLTIGDNVNPAPLAVAGKLNVRTEAIAVDVPAGSEAAALRTVRDATRAGYHGGDWAGGNGITSSNAATDRSKAIGYGLSTELPMVPGRFFGIPLDDSTVVALYTLAGDATLDGHVDFNDLVKLAQNYNSKVSDTTDSWWTHGDFTYDGTTDFNDLVKLAQNYNTSLPGDAIPGATPSFEADLARAFANVPEPGALALLGLAACRSWWGRRPGSRGAGRREGARRAPGIPTRIGRMHAANRVCKEVQSLA